MTKNEPEINYDNDTQDSLAEWQQGDFSLDCSDFLYLNVPSSTGGEETSEAVFDASVEGCVVISQTCDVVRELAILPYVTVCPLVKIKAERRADIEKGQAPRFGLVDNAPKACVVDFSRTMSVKKELLVKWKRQRGCANEKQLLNFGQSLERFFGRFAFPDSFNDSLKSLRGAIYSKHAKNSKLGKALRSIREIRVLPHASWNDTKSIPITFIFVLEDEEKRELKDRTEIKKAMEKKLNIVGWVSPFSLHKDGIYLATLSELSAVEYLNSYSLDLNSLSFAKHFQVTP